MAGRHLAGIRSSSNGNSTEKCKYRCNEAECLVNKIYCKTSKYNVPTGV